MSEQDPSEQEVRAQELSVGQRDVSFFEDRLKRGLSVWIIGIIGLGIIRDFGFIEPILRMAYFIWRSITRAATGELSFFEHVEWNVSYGVWLVSNQDSFLCGYCLPLLLCAAVAHLLLPPWNSK
jgi:hypothetical protein